jgi:ssDNA-binding Zn-finger/Zn-ribbon topoisomerase 1
MMPVQRIIPDVMKEHPKTESATATGEKASPYGNCPECGAAGKMREKRPNGNDICENGHKYASASAVYAKTQTTARVENVVEGACPSCGTQMRLSSANGIPVHVCMQHSVVMPLRDPTPI